MLTQSFTHKSHKITTLTTDSYKQLFVLITMLLTVLSVQPSTFTMAAPMQQQLQLQYQPQQYQLTQPQLQPLEQHNLPYDFLHQQPSQLYEILLAEKQHLETDNVRTRREEMENIANLVDVDKIFKRQINFHDSYHITMQSQTINWYNPCGGIHKMAEKPVKRKRPPPIKKELRKLQNATVKYYNFIKENLHAINIGNMKQWDSAAENYSFLPKLNTNSSISLRHWHRQMQIYVAAFEYLHRAQLHFDYLKDNQKSPFAKELNLLMINARTILCNIEHAINNTTTRKRATNIDSLFINRTRMENILNFATNIKYVSPLRWHDIRTDDKSWTVNVLDLRFAKSHYYVFLRKLMKTLRMHTKRPGPIKLGRNVNQNKTKNKQNQQVKQQKNRQNHEIKLRHSKKNSNKY
ncbi:hypothetical protein CVS40_3205 [Lucilia cuprina]|nr:hypothetical protein CVS40_3205 [Lucilia cuprina]